MVAGSGQRIAVFPQPIKDESQILACGINNGSMVKPHTVRRGRRCILTLPSIEANMMMIASGGDECRLITIHQGKFKTQQADIESKGFLQVRYFQMHMAYSGLGGNRVILIAVVHNWWIGSGKNEMGRRSALILPSVFVFDSLFFILGSWLLILCTCYLILRK